MSKIYENNLLYNLGKPYVVWTFKQYFDEYIILGKENIPVDEPVIFAPNHLNALMDALAILSLPPMRQVKVYLSRADLFHLPKWMVQFLRFAKLMPAFRIRDGYENLGRNKESFEEADSVLLNNASMVIMPEGNQGEEKKVRSLVKGIFRIAFGAQEKMQAGKSVKILPIGIDTGDFIKFGKHLIINIGKPIEVADYMDLYEDNPAKAINALKDHLQQEMKNLALHLSSETYYTCFETTVEAVNHSMLNNLQLENNTQNQFIAKQKIAKILTEIETTQPEIIEKLDKLCKRYQAGLQKVNLQNRNLEKQIPSVYKNQLSNVLLAVNACIFLPGFILNFLPFKTPTLFPKILNIQYSGFFSSVHYGVGILAFPLFYTLQAIVLISLLSLPGWLFFILIPLQYLLGKISFSIYKQMKSLLADKRLYLYNKNNATDLKFLYDLKQKITETVLSRDI